MQDTLATMIAYSQWADDLVIEAISMLTDDQYCRKLGGGFESVQALVAHVAGTASVWRMRFEGGHASALPRDEQLPTLDEARQELTRAYQVLAREAARPMEELDELFGYRNTRGQDISLPRWVTLRQFVNHATYHRGQLASMLRRLDRTPPPTDFLIWVLEQQAAATTATTS